MNSKAPVLSTFALQPPGRLRAHCRKDKEEKRFSYTVTDSEYQARTFIISPIKVVVVVVERGWWGWRQSVVFMFVGCLFLISQDMYSCCKAV